MDKLQQPHISLHHSSNKQETTNQKKGKSRTRHQNFQPKVENQNRQFKVRSLTSLIFNCPHCKQHFVHLSYRNAIAEIKASLGQSRETQLLHHPKISQGRLHQMAVPLPETHTQCKEQSDGNTRYARNQQQLKHVNATKAEFNSATTSPSNATVQIEAKTATEDSSITDQPPPAAPDSQRRCARVPSFWERRGC